MVVEMSKDFTMTSFNITATPFDPEVDYFEEQFAVQNSWIYDVSPFELWSDDDFPIAFKQHYYWLFDSAPPLSTALSTAETPLTPLTAETPMTPLTPLTPLTYLTPLSPEIFYDCVV
jgi:hypothetical protein